MLARKTTARQQNLRGYVHARRDTELARGRVLNNNIAQVQNCRYRLLRTRRLYSADANFCNGRRYRRSTVKSHVHRARYYGAPGELHFAGAFTLPRLFPNREHGGGRGGGVLFLASLFRRSRTPMKP